MGIGARHRAPRSSRSTAGRWKRFRRQCVVLALVAVLLVTVGSPLVILRGTYVQTTSVTHAPKAISFDTPSPIMLPPKVTYGPFPVTEPTPVHPVQVESSLPIRIEVPRLNFQVRVEGNWLGSPIDPPFDPETVDDVVYFDTSRGESPGSSTERSSYFAGHTCRKDGCLAAFDVLDQQLRQGDDVYVTTEASEALGLRLHYVVKDSVLYSQETLPSATRIWRKIPNRLVFITCNLREDGAEQTDNHVLFARYVGLE